MLASQVYQALDDLNQQKTEGVSREAVAYLQEKGLVSVLSSNDYQARQNDVRSLEIVNRQTENYSSQIPLYESKITRLSGKLYSKWHRFFSSWTRIEDEERQLANLKANLEQTQQKHEETKSEKARLEAVQRDLASYVRISDVFARPTDIGQKRAKQLGARISRLGNTDYQESEREIENVAGAIDARYQRFKQFYEFLIDKGFSRDSKVVYFALSLSGLEGSMDEIYERAKVVNGWLYEKKWQNYDRLSTVAAVTSQKGDITQLRDHLEEVFTTMIENGHSKTYETWREAAGIMKIEGADAKEKYKRFDEMQDELDKRQWQKGKPTTCYVAANLTQKQGDVVQIAEEFRNLEKKLVEKGRNDCVESGIAALVLMNNPGTLDEKTDRFNETFEMLHKYGWPKNQELYPATAMTSVMPGTVEENVMWLDEITEQMKGDGFKNLKITSMAIPIIGGGYRKILRQTDTPLFVSSSPLFDDERQDRDHHQDYDQGGCGFSLTGAVVGDLIDDSSLDLSGGFLLGGIVGGVIEDFFSDDDDDDDDDYD